MIPWPCQPCLFILPLRTTKSRGFTLSIDFAVRPSRMTLTLEGLPMRTQSTVPLNDLPLPCLMVPEKRMMPVASSRRTWTQQSPFSPTMRSTFSKPGLMEAEAAGVGVTLGLGDGLPMPSAPGLVDGCPSSPPVFQNVLRIVGEKGDCWVQVRRDDATGIILFSGTIKQGSGRSFKGTVLWVRMGNPSS